MLLWDGRFIALVGLILVPPLAPEAATGQSPARWRPPEGQHCTPFPFPARMPAVGELLDSASTLSILAADSGFARGRELLAVTIDTTGALRQLRILETNLPPPAARRLATALASLINPLPASAMGQLRLDVALAAQPQLSVSRSELCHASLKPGQVRNVVDSVRVERLGSVRIRDNDMASAQVDMGSPMLDPAMGPPPLATRWLVTVDTSGRAQDAIPLVRPPGAPDMRKAVLQLKFNPALLDRVPVMMSDTVTIGAP